jgi:hypothetical protein
MACGGCQRIREAVLSGIRIVIRKSEPPPNPEPPSPRETVIARNVSWPLKRAKKAKT